MKDSRVKKFVESNHALTLRIEALEAERDKLKADLTETLMQSLSDLGQAQDAYEAQRKAEAERDRMRKALEAINSMPTGSTSRIPHAMQQIAFAALRETKK